MFVLHAASATHTYNVRVHSVLSTIVQPFVYVVPALVQSPALIQLYFEYDKLKLSAPYNVIVTFDVNVHPAGVPLTVGFVKSTFAPFDVKFVVLQFHAASHTFVQTTVHVAHAHSPIVHVTGVHDTIPANQSVYVNVDVWVLVYHHAYVLFVLNAGAVLSNLIAFDVALVTLQFHNLSHIFVHTAVHVDVAHSVLIVHDVVTHPFIPAHASVYVNVDN